MAPHLDHLSVLLLLAVPCGSGFGQGDYDSTVTVVVVEPRPVPIEAATEEDPQPNAWRWSVEAATARWYELDAAASTGEVSEFGRATLEVHDLELHGVGLRLERDLDPWTLGLDVAAGEWRGDGRVVYGEGGGSASERLDGDFLAGALSAYWPVFARRDERFELRMGPEVGATWMSLDAERSAASTTLDGWSGFGGLRVTAARQIRGLRVFAESSARSHFGDWSGHVWSVAVGIRIGF